MAHALRPETGLSFGQIVLNCRRGIATAPQNQPAVQESRMMALPAMMRTHESLPPARANFGFGISDFRFRICRHNSVISVNPAFMRVP